MRREATMHGPTDGLAALCAARPCWTRLVCAREAVPLEGRWLLHAGPPFADPRRLPAPVLASAVLACWYEGWASSEGDAQRLIEDGSVQVTCAQSHRCVTPLAYVVSPSAPLIAVEDCGRSLPPVYAPLGATGGPDLRFGTRDRTTLERLRIRDGEEAPLLRAALSAPIDLLDIAREALAHGDDLHNRTAAATQALGRALAIRFGPSASSAADRLLAAVSSTPLYFLTFWMAAARYMLSAAEGMMPSSLVTSLAGNGESVGVQLAGAPGRWTTVPAAPPQGPRLAHAPVEAKVLGAIGDSAVIDALGLGGQALALAAEPRSALQEYLPGHYREVAQRVLSVRHPAFGSIDLRVGLDARRVVASGALPIVTLGMVEEGGHHGLLGRGVYVPPMELFRAALASLHDGQSAPNESSNQPGGGVRT